MAAHIAICDNDVADHTACCKSTMDEQEGTANTYSTVTSSTDETTEVIAITQ